MRVPRAAPTRIELGGGLDRGAPCAAGGRLEDCVRELSTRQARVARLHAAQRAEACRGDGCAAAWAEARRQYTGLAAFEDTGPDALLGLARVLRRLGDPPREPGARPSSSTGSRDRTFEEVLPVRLVVALLARRRRRGRCSTLAEAVLAGRYPLDPVVRLGVLARIRALLGERLTPAERRRAGTSSTTQIARSAARGARGGGARRRRAGADAHRDADLARPSRCARARAHADLSPARPTAG